MEPNLMLKTAAVLFGIAAIGGLGIAVMRFSGTPRPPAWFAMAHGLLAGAALTLLIYAAVTVGVPLTAQIALAIFLVVAAVGAFMNLNFHWKLLPLPTSLVTAHGAAAVWALGLLCYSVWAMPQA